MKKLYEKPDAEYVELLIEDALMNAGLDASMGFGEDEDEGH